MGEMMEQFDKFSAVVKIRRGDDWIVRPEMEFWDGKEIEVECGWMMGEDDRSQYSGEWAMIVKSPEVPVAWIAEGDLILTPKSHQPLNQTE